MTTPTLSGGHPDEVLDLLQAVNRHCGICGHAIEKSSWLTHHGKRVHPSCFVKSGEAPDIVSGHGIYAEGGSCACLDIDAPRAVVRERLLDGGLL